MTAGLVVSTHTRMPSRTSASTRGTTRSSSRSSDTWQRTGPRRFTADVDDIGPVRDHLARVVERLFALDELSAIGERVRRDVENAHHARVRQVESLFAEAQVA